MIKITADDIFDGRKFHGPDRALVLDDNATVSALVPLSWVGEDFIRVEGVLSPGFINTHCHLELSHMKGAIPPGTGLPAFLTAVMENRQPPAAEVLASAIDSAAEDMHARGIVAVGDIANTAATAAVKIRTAQQTEWRTFVECMGVSDQFAPQRLEHSLSVLAQFRQHSISANLVPHAPYSVSPTLFRLINGLQHNDLISIHNQESQAENELFRHKTGPFLDFYRHFNMDASGIGGAGLNSLPAYIGYFDKAQTVLLVHNTFTTRADVESALSRTGDTYWCLCPNANLYIEGMLPDVPMLMGTPGANITLGTDSLASNHQLCIWSEITTLREKFPSIPLETMLQWATLNGAEALGIADRFGSFEKGKSPGIVQIVNNEARRLHMQSLIV
ncbi:amidohydrolase family protein [Chitinophaga sp.]|uniref:amidohydrolase family protein n=1 Tax=Chitinophaga sp. TaxID=1869181 RepID=UPI0026208175|nr:amidohydrolase family protein [uncultured Chitinophaga sp.]